MDKQNTIYPYNGILVSHKRNEALIQATIWMNLENIMLSEGSQSQKTTYYTIPFIRKFRIRKSIDTEVD